MPSQRAACRTPSPARSAGARKRSRSNLYFHLLHAWNREGPLNPPPNVLPHMPRVPITLALRPGFEHDSNSYRSPVIEIGVGAIPEFTATGEALNPDAPVVWVRALIDSGADSVTVDSGILNQLGVPSLGITSTTLTPHDERNHDEHAVKIYLPSIGISFEACVTSLSLRNGRRAYDAILGMEFLKHGRLVLDAAGESYFDIRI